MTVRKRRLLAAVVTVLLLDAAWLEAQVVRLPAVMPPSQQYPGRVVSHPEHLQDGQRRGGADVEEQARRTLHGVVLL